MSGPDERGAPRRFSGVSDADLRAELERIVAVYPQKRAGALMCLHHVQQNRGCVSLQDQVLVGEVIGISPAHVRELMTFYTMLYESYPAEYHLQLCRTLSCQLRGARDLRRCIGEKLGIGPGQATPDGRFRLTEVECLASCGTAPVIQVNDDYFEDLTVDDLQALLDSLENRSLINSGGK